MFNQTKLNEKRMLSSRNVKSFKRESVKEGDD